MQLTSEQVLALAPYASSATAGKKLGVAKAWQGLGKSVAPPPKTLITPALFSRPLRTPHTGRRGRKAR
ncbi:MAG: hypothetical protein ACREMY_34270, partial [bacterium]